MLANRDAIISDVITMHDRLERFLASPRIRAESVAARSQLVVYRIREIGIRVRSARNANRSSCWWRGAE